MSHSHFNPCALLTYRFDYIHTAGQRWECGATPLRSMPRILLILRTYTRVCNPERHSKCTDECIRDSSVSESS